MGARLKDLGLGMVAAGWLAGASWMMPAGDVLAAPSGETLPTMCWILTLSAAGALFAVVVRMLVGGLG